MSAPQPKTAASLTPEASALIETYFARVRSVMLVSAAGEAAEAVEELRAHVLEELAGTDGSATAVSRVLGDLGAPEVLGAAYGEADTDAAPPALRAEDDAGPGRGTLLGMPYDLRMPTTDRVASRWWNPHDPHVFVPRVFGLGWDVNFGALAVKLAIARPDDEDEPFATVPRGWLLAALALPALISAALLGLLAVRYAGMPAFVPSHWDLSGAPDRLWRKDVLAAFVLALSVVPTLLATSAFVRRSPAVNRAAGAAAASLLATVALTQLAHTLLTLDGAAVGTWPALAGVVLALVLPFLLLTGLSRIGRAAEQRRDLRR